MSSPGNDENVFSPRFEVPKPDLSRSIGSPELSVSRGSFQSPPPAKIKLSNMSLLADKDLELLDGEVKTQDLGAAPSYQSSVLDNPDYFNSAHTSMPGHNRFTLKQRSRQVSTMLKPPFLPYQPEDASNNEAGRKDATIRATHPDPCCRHCGAHGAFTKDCMCGAAVRERDDNQLASTSNEKDGQAKNVGDGRKCRNCGEAGHLALGCLNPPKCRLCDGAHSTDECADNRKMALRKVVDPDKPKMLQMVAAGFDDVDKEQATVHLVAIFTSAVACEDVALMELGEKAFFMTQTGRTYPHLAEFFISHKIKLCVVCVEVEPGNADHIVRWDGTVITGDRVYRAHVTTITNFKPRYALDMTHWPEDLIDNNARMEFCGKLAGKDLKQCTMCWAYTHSREKCDRPAREPEKCFNCGEPGHMKRDCSQPMVEGCLGCKKSGHSIAKCQDPEWLKSVNDWKCPSCKTNDHTEFPGEGGCPDYYTLRGQNEPNCPRCKDVKCYNFACNKCSSCNSRDHKYKDCPKCPKCGLVIKNDDGSPNDAWHIPKLCPERNNVPWYCQDCAAKHDAGTSCPNKACKKCQKVGHGIKDCPEVVCKNCGFGSHSLSDCRYVNRVPCLNCGADDHKEKNCPNPKRNAGVRGLGYYFGCEENESNNQNDGADGGRESEGVRDANVTSGSGMAGPDAGIDGFGAKVTEGDADTPWDADKQDEAGGSGW